MTANNLQTPLVFAIIDGKEIYDSNLNRISIETLRGKKDFFIKDIDGECASFVKHIDNYDMFCEIMKNLPNGRYILQERVIQHSGMNVINPDAINTMRIVTVYNNGEPQLLSLLLRVGTTHTGNVDNWAAGGLAIGVEKTGFLKQYGFYKPGHGTKVATHPDTKIVFENFQIPMYEEAIKAALNAHRYFYNVGAIGWDVAISETGPVFIEGNDNFEITLCQACDGGLKQKWKQYV